VDTTNNDDGREDDVTAAAADTDTDIDIDDDDDADTWWREGEPDSR